MTNKQTSPKEIASEIAKGCREMIDAIGYIHCGDEITENGVPQGEYFYCPSCKLKAQTLLSAYKEEKIFLEDYSKRIKNKFKKLSEIIAEQDPEVVANLIIGFSGLIDEDKEGSIVLRIKLLTESIKILGGVK